MDWFPFFWKSNGNLSKDLKKLAELPEDKRQEKLVEERSKLIVKHKLTLTPVKLAKGVVGLNNLGNTCYMNSVLQCLSHCPDLRDMFLQREWWTDLNPLSSPTKGELACEFYMYLIKYWTSTRDSFSPSSMKAIISKAKSSFSGWDQHDAQELLTYFLDSLHEDLNRVVIKPYRQMEDFKEGGDIKQFLNVAYEMHTRRNQSALVDLFHGQFYTKIICPESECKHESIVGDPFEMLSLTVPDRGSTSLPFYFLPAGYESTIEKYKVECYLDQSTTDVLNHFKHSVDIHKHKRLKMFLYSRLRLVAEASEQHVMTIGPLNESDYVPMICQTIDPKIWRLVFGSRTDTLLESAWEKTPKLRVQTFLNGEYTGVERLLEVPDDTTFQEVQLLLYLLFRKPFIEAKLSPFTSESGYPQTREDVESESEYFQRNLLENQEFSRKVKVKMETGDGIVKSFNDPLFENARNKTLKVSYNLDLENVDGKALNLRGTIAEKIDRMGPSLSRSVADCLDIFTKEEMLDTDNKWYCPRCKDHKMASRETLLNRVPPILIIHLRRFKKVPGKHGHFTKMVTKIDVPMELDVSPFVYQPTQPHKFSLFGVVNHFGNLNGGHYTASAKSDDGNWVYYDDDTAKRLRPDDVGSSAAYVLFFRRV